MPTAKRISPWEGNPEKDQAPPAGKPDLRPGKVLRPTENRFAQSGRRHRPAASPRCRAGVPTRWNRSAHAVQRVGGKAERPRASCKRGDRGFRNSSYFLSSLSSRSFNCCAISSTDVSLASSSGPQSSASSTPNFAAMCCSKRSDRVASLSARRLICSSRWSRLVQALTDEDAGGE